MPEHITHAFPPVYDTESRVLILGTMPSPKSRENGFYYGHPRNRFWKVLADVLSQPLPETNEAKTCFLHRNHIALWDVLASCEIHRADDSSIRNPVPNDFLPILAAAPIRTIFTTGTKAAALYKRYCYPQTRIPAVPLPLHKSGQLCRVLRTVKIRLRGSGGSSPMKMDSF